MRAEKNIYDKFGKLLIAKNQEITDRIYTKLKSFYVSEEESKKNEPQKHIKNIDIKIDAKELNEKLKLSDTKILDYPTNIINQILFESKAKPWWLLVNSISNYIDWVYTHSINVSLISLMLAIKMGYSSEALYEVALGSLLHDVGKLLIPKSILQKNTKLNNQEMLMIKQHCDLGVSITNGLSLPDTCVTIIQQHHERNNGSGYPFGLKEEKIHHYAKIVMIADVVDAITSYRPYKPAKELHEALELLKIDNMFSNDLIVILETLL